MKLTDKQALMLQQPDDTDPPEIGLRVNVEDTYCLALNKPRILAAVCRELSIQLTTEWYSLRRDHWIVTLRDGRDVSGTMHEVILFVRGYAAALLAERATLRIKLETIRDAAIQLMER